MKNNITLKLIICVLSFLVIGNFAAFAENQKTVVVVPLFDESAEPNTGLEFDNTPISTSVASISTCSSRTILKQVTLTVPESATQNYIVCRASGRTFHSQTEKWVFYSIDDATGTASDVFAYTGIVTSTSTYNNYDPYAMQEVYLISAAGGTFSYYLKACRQDTDTTGTAYHDDFTCELFSKRY